MFQQFVTKQPCALQPLVKNLKKTNKHKNKNSTIEPIVKLYQYKKHISFFSMMVEHYHSEGSATYKNKNTR